MKDVQSSGSGSQIVAMMQPTEPRHGNNSASCTGTLFCPTSSVCSFVQRKMRSVVVVVTEVLVHKTLQVPLIENDDMIQEVSSTIPDPALGNAVLSRASEAGSFGLNTETLYGAQHLVIEVCGSVKDQIFWRGVVGKCFPQLLRNPSTAWMSGHIAMKNSPSVMRYDEETIENSECERRHDEEIHCGDGLAMIV